jgi:hypothetical protein
MIRAQRLLREHRPTIVLTIAAFLPLLAWWFATIPGFYSPDSIAVVDQVRTGNWSNVHTTAYTAWVYVTSLGGRSWSLVTLSQVALVGSCLVIFGRSVVQRGISLIAVTATLATLTSLPHVGGLSVSVWKDVPYVAGAVLVAAGLLRRTVHSARQLPPWLLITVGCALIATHRWNGPITVLLIACGAAIAWRDQWIRFAAVGLTTAVIGTLTLVLPARLGLVDTGNWLLLNSSRLHDVAVAVERDPAFAERSAEVLESVMPLDEWKAGGANCTTHDTLLFDHLSVGGDERIEQAIARRDDLSSLWWSTVRERPQYLALARLCRGAGAWWPLPVISRLPNSLWPLDASDPDLRWARYSPPMTTVAIRAAESTNWNHAVHWSLTRPTVSFIVLGGVLWIIGRRRQLREFAAVLPLIAAVILSAGLTAVAHDPRYVAGANIVIQVVGVSLILDAVLRGRRVRRVNDR